MGALTVSGDIEKQNEAMQAWLGEITALHNRLAQHLEDIGDSKGASLHLALSVAHRDFKNTHGQLTGTGSDVETFEGSTDDLKIIRAMESEI